MRQAVAGRLFRYLNFLIQNTLFLLLNPTLQELYLLKVQKYQLNEVIGIVLISLLCVGLTILGLKSSGPDLLNYQAYQAGELTGHIAIQIYIFITQLFGVGQLYGIESFLIIVYALLSSKLNMNARNGVLTTAVFTLFFLLSYESASLYGNILRQGFATFLVLFLYPLDRSEKFGVFQIFGLGLCMLIHLSALPLIFWLSIMERRFVKKISKKIYMIAALLFFVVLYIGFDFLIARFYVLGNNRDLMVDFSGYFYAAFSFFLSMILVKVPGRRRIYLFKWFLVVIFATAIFGEFGQRVLIGLSFVTVFYILQKQVVSNFVVLVIAMKIGISSLAMIYKIGFFFEVLR